MTKLREPGSFEAAVLRIIGDMTAEVAAAAVGKSTRLVRLWSDPDDDTLPNLRQAFALDTAYLADPTTPAAAPIHSVYGRMLEAAERPATNRLGCGFETLTEALREFTEAADAFRAADADMSPMASIEAMQEIEEAIEALRGMAEHIEARRAQEARP
ncbi:MAG: hypothetical protein MI785_14980 [Kiloniellales bacterium]|nr:hypothetical protein [Kiloniellales bacterium]